MKLMEIISLIDQGRASDTSIAESGSDIDIDDPCSSLGRRSSTVPALAAVDEEVSVKLQLLNIV